MVERSSPVTGTPATNSAASLDRAAPTDGVAGCSSREALELDAYFDAVPRSAADAVGVGAFTLFVSRTPSAYYARPARTSIEAIVESDLTALEKACADHHVPLSIEWVAEVHPELLAVAAAFGLETRSHALLVAPAATIAAQVAIAAANAAGVTLRVINADDPVLPLGRAVAEISFGFGGTGTGPPGPHERDAVAACLPADLIAHQRQRHRLGLTVTAVAESGDKGVLAVGSYQPVGDMAEIVGIATLPSARRRGLAGAVTATLAAYAVEHGTRTMLLSAEDDDVARIYERVGFRRAGSTGAAERPAPE